MQVENRDKEKDLQSNQSVTIKTGAERDLALGAEHTRQQADEVLQGSTLETYMSSLTNVTPMNSIKNKIKSFSIFKTKNLGWMYQYQTIQTLRHEYFYT